MTIQRFFYSGAGSASAVTITARDQGRVKEVWITAAPSVAAAGGAVAAEISLQQNSQLTVNDARNVLARTGGIDPALGMPVASKEHPQDNVRIGDAIYLHTTTPGGAVNIIVEGYLLIGR